MHPTREQWLNHLAQLLRPDFARAGTPLPPNIRFSCGWPGAGDRHKRLGECWHAKASADGSFEVFVSPTLSHPLQVGPVLVHELCHTAVGVDAGHGPLFRRCALAVGLTGKMRSTEATPELIERLQALTTQTGPYPHAQLNPADRPTKKDGTRLLKVACPDCGYTVRVTRKWLDVGNPVCPCGEEMAECV